MQNAAFDKIAADKAEADTAAADKATSKKVESESESSRPALELKPIVEKHDVFVPDLELDAGVVYVQDECGESEEGEEEIFVPDAPSLATYRVGDESDEDSMLNILPEEDNIRLNSASTTNRGVILGTSTATPDDSFNGMYMDDGSIDTHDMHSANATPAVTPAASRRG